MLRADIELAPRQANILDPVHPELDDRVWDNPEDQEPHLMDAHRNWIHQHIVGVLADHGYDGMENWLSLVLTGSLTTYQYSDESDCDVSLFVDTKNFPDWSRAEMIGLMVSHVDGTKLPGTPHPMQCFVVSPQIKKEDLYKQGLRSGYDLDTDQWLVPPDKSRVHDVEREMNESYTIALESADKMEHLLRYEPDKAKLYWHQIHQRRQRDMRAGKGDYAPSNVVYKMLNNRGLFPAIAESTGEYIAHTAAGINELPPREWAYVQLLKKGGLDPRSPFMPWLVNHIKQGNIVHSPHYNGDINELIAARESGDRLDQERYMSRLTGGWHGPGNAHQLFHLAKTRPLGIGEDAEEPADVEDLLPHLRRHHQWATRNQPNYNLNSLNPMGVLNAVDARQKERTKGFGRVVHTYDNGWTIRQLRNAEEAAHEGAAMSNCIGDYYRNNGWENIYSLRDEKNRPKVSIEMRPDGRSAGDNGKKWAIEQIFEKANSDVRPAFKGAIKQWYDTLKAKGHQITGESYVPINHVRDLGKPMIDDYGLEARPEYDWPKFYNSLLKPGGRAYRYIPENIEAGVQSVINNPYTHAIHYLADQNDRQVRAIQQVRNAVPPQQWEGMKEAPYIQSVGHIQRLLEPYKRPSPWADNEFVYRRENVEPGTEIVPNPRVHVFASIVPEHINPWGEPCTCPWGGGKS